MRHFILLFIPLFIPLFVYAQFTVNGTTVVGVESKIKDITKIFICESLSQKDATLSFPFSETDTYSCWYYQKGDQQPKAYPNYEINSGKIIFKGLKDQTAYGIKRNNDPITFVWIINYEDHRLILEHLSPIDSDDACSDLKLHISAKADPLIYYSLSGFSEEVEREYTLEYTTLSWSEADKKFSPQHMRLTKGIRIPETIISEPPLCNTSFIFSGDQFQDAFGKVQQIVSEEYQAIRTSAVAIARLNSSITMNSAVADSDKLYISMPIDGNDSPINLEGSAPLNIDFLAYGNNPVTITKTWEIATDDAYIDLESQYTDAYTENNSTFSYPFDKAGIYYVRLINSSAANRCECITNSFRIKIYDSKLEIPNAFSPGTDGINDIFKVSYQSIIRFKGWIFNRWGNQLFHWSDPSEGWDGSYNGKKVSSGVYFYVIEAEGSDGRIYKKKGDINLFREK